MHTGRTPSLDEPTRALSRLLKDDPRFAVEPRRLGRALADLLPYDDLAVRLLALGAELGIPSLVERGEADAAAQALVERAGVRPELADWVVDVWSGVVTGAPPLRARDTWGTVRLAAWPDGTLLIVARTAAGVFGMIGDSPWTLIAPATGSPDGEVAISLHDGRALVVWLTDLGAYAAEVRPGHGMPVAERVVEPRPGLTPTGPMAVLSVDESLHHLVWPVDGHRLRRGIWRSWPADDPDEDLPEPPAPDETVVSLAVARATADVARLAAVTGRGRLSTTRWELTWGDVAAWEPVAVPGEALTVAAAGRRLFAGLRTGEVVEVIAGAAPVSWLGASSGDRFRSAAQAGDTTWLAVESDGSLRLTGFAPDRTPGPTRSLRAP